MKRLALSILLLLVVAGSLSAFPLIHRSSKVRHDFMRMTGYPHGRHGYIIDHVIPLCAGGPDAVTNLQWQTVKAAKAKDVEEKRLCAEIRRARRVQVRVP